MAGLNKCFFIGRFGKDPEVSYTGSGKAKASFSLAVSENFRDADGKKQEITTWLNVVAWNKLAEVVGEHCKKGKLILLEARYVVRTFKGRDEQTKYVHEHVALNIQFLSSNPDQPATEAEQSDDLPL